jgi:hypothetical protein
MTFEGAFYLRHNRSPAEPRTCIHIAPKSRCVGRRDRFDRTACLAFPPRAPPVIIGRRAPPSAAPVVAQTSRAPNPLDTPHGPPVRHVEATQAGISDGAAEMPQSSFFLRRC